MVGKFLFGMLSGGLLVMGGLVVGSAMFPLRTTDAANSTEMPSAGSEEAATAQADTSQAPAEAIEPEPVLGAEDTSTTDVVVATVAGAGKPTEWVEPDSTALTEPGTASALPIAEPSAPAEPLSQPEAGPTAPVDVVQPEVLPAPLVLPQPDTDSVLETLDKSAAPQPGIASEAGPEPEMAEQTPVPEPEPEPMPEPEPAPELVEVEPAPEADVPSESPETAGLPGTEVPEMPGQSPNALPETEILPEAEAAETGDGTAEAAPEPEVAAMPEIEAGPTFKPAPGVGLKTDGVIVGRLPRIGDAPAPESETAEIDAEAVPDDPRPIARFAADFENADGKPVLAIVLIDPGTADLDRDMLAALPFPVSIALDPTDPATPDRAAIYRAAGKEVVMLATGLADGARASDVEVSFQSMAQGLPEAVAVMDLPGAQFQNNRPLASLVVPVVGAQGRGLLTWDQGLNAADQVARREDIAAAVVFRDMESAGTDSGSIRRILDRAVFKAGQDGRVTLAGTASPATVAALLEWTVEGRAATVALAPLTAAMRID
ncbi:divergent polysaccharide deacetylase family protein [Tabrizicola sp.]|uniref:divergent polysaccharide deacetylase family protein n=1 Tax=Tabrizicola sp. TaxID=2005166 RepID=UPI00262B6E27|nr:divergent polysaccharide deacetylase family protein [Tabrizicola sp.]MDM7930510.1 divergent polysaccharide deacetylase family protein [Tabrizicola sp.]